MRFSTFFSPVFSSAAAALVRMRSSLFENNIAAEIIAAVVSALSASRCACPLTTRLSGSPGSPSRCYSARPRRARGMYQARRRGSHEFGSPPLLRGYSAVGNGGDEEARTARGRTRHHSTQVVRDTHTYALDVCQFEVYTHADMHAGNMCTST